MSISLCFVPDIDHYYPCNSTSLNAIYIVDAADTLGSIYMKAALTNLGESPRYVMEVDDCAIAIRTGQSGGLYRLTR